MSSISFCRSIGIHVLLAIVVGITEFPLPGNSIPANETCVNVSGENICYFKGSEKLLKWNESKHLCSSFNSTLPVIRTADDQDAVAGYLKSLMNNYSIAWTAGRNFIHSNWTCINEEPLKEFVQDAIELQENRMNDEEKDYAALNTDFTFTALPAYYELPYICKYKGDYCSSSSDINMIDKCLRLINDSRTWYDARNQCLMTGGDLAVISDDVHGHLTEQLTLNQSFWIGLRMKSWRWIRNDNGDSNDEIKYTNWDINAFSRDGECISIGTSDGKWKALGCDQHQAVVCQKVSAAVGAGMVIIICFIVIIVFALRIRRTSVNLREIGRPKFNNGPTHNYPEELESRITNAPVDTSVSEHTNAPVQRSDDIQSDYMEIPLSTLDQSEYEATNQEPGNVYASLECQKPIYLDPNMKRNHTASPTSPTKIGPLGDIYAMPDANAKGNASTSPGNTSVGSASHPIMITAQGDVYALPMKNSKLPTAKHPGEVLYANLQTEMLSKERTAEGNVQTK